jgi:sugar/nucleoside kinase (ribokinase family)
LTRIEISIPCFKLAASSNAIISLDVQGFARGVQADKVIPREWAYAPDVLQFVDIVKADVHELTAITGFDTISEARDILFSHGVQILVLTRDRDGSTIYTQTEQLEIPLVLAERVVDTTGSGDTYMIGFLCEYMRTHDLFHSGVFAATSASLNLESIGPYSMPSRAEVEKRMIKYL